MDTPGQQRSPHAPLLLALPALLFAGSELYQRAELQLNGTIVSATTGCMQPWNNRCASTYVIEARDGSRQTYVAGSVDHALPRRLAVGTVVVKNRWVLSYSLNGRKIDDFPIFFYAGVAVLGLGGAGWWVLRRASRTAVAPHH